jgi:hypothetical protein
MTRDQAVEVTVKAILRRHGHREDTWKGCQFLDQAKDLIAALEALGLFEPTTE